MVTTFSLPNISDVELEEESKKFEAITARIHDVQQQIKETGDLEEKGRLELKEKRLKEERIEICERIKLLEGQIRRIGEEELAELNFTEQRNSLTCWIKPDEHANKAIAFLIHAPRHYGCDYLIIRFRQEIQRLNFRWVDLVEIKFSHNDWFDKNRLLTVLGEKVGLPAGDYELDHLLERFNQKLKSCHFLLLVIHEVDELLAITPDTLTWLMEEFWHNLVTHATTLNRRVYLSLILVCHKRLPPVIHKMEPDSNPAYEDYDNRQLIYLPKLKERISKQDIASWIETYLLLNKERSQDEAQKILDDTENGFPILVFDKLKELAADLQVE
ncbi:MAG: hypothetical protein HS126_08210 [Anaerolineales bacterium]|nr:hypothetical protein [Anaerolineales bacterium]